MRAWAWLGGVALGLGASGLLGCPGEGEGTASPSPALTPTPPPAPQAIASVAASAAALPALPSGLGAAEAFARLQAQGYLLGAGPSPVGGRHLAYLEAWRLEAQPKALLLSFQGSGAALRLGGVQADPSASAWQALLLDGDLDLTNREVEERAIAFAEDGVVGLIPIGEHGEDWEAEGGWRLTLKPGATAQLKGPHGSHTLPLQGRWGQPDRIRAAYVSANAKALGLVERLPHSGLHVVHLLAFDPRAKAYAPARFER